MNTEAEMLDATIRRQLSGITHALPITEGHTITVGFDSHYAAPYSAICMCGWHSTSASAELRNWNFEGHVSDVAR